MNFKSNFLRTNYLKCLSSWPKTKMQKYAPHIETYSLYVSTNSDHDVRNQFWDVRFYRKIKNYTLLGGSNLTEDGLQDIAIAELAFDFQLYLERLKTTAACLASIDPAIEAFNYLNDFLIGKKKQQLNFCSSIYKLNLIYLFLIFFL